MQKIDKGCDSYRAFFGRSNCQNKERERKRQPNPQTDKYIDNQTGRNIKRNPEIYINTNSLLKEYINGNNCSMMYRKRFAILFSFKPKFWKVTLLADRRADREALPLKVELAQGQLWADLQGRRISESGDEFRAEMSSSTSSRSLYEARSIQVRHLQTICINLHYSLFYYSNHNGSLFLSYFLHKISSGNILPNLPTFFE